MLLFDVNYYPYNTRTERRIQDLLHVQVTSYKIHFPLAQAYTCKYNDAQCKNQTLIGSPIRLYGYKSGIDVNAISSGALACDGSHSCIGSTLITNGSDAMQITGEFAAFDSTMTSSADMAVEGAYAAGNAQISAAGTVKCHANSACRNSTITNTAKIEAYGAYSAYDTTITSNSALTVEFLGHKSGENALIICKDGDECAITCMDANACVNTICDGCNITYTYSSSIDVPSMVEYDAFALLTSKEAECNSDHCIFVGKISLSMSADLES